VSSNRSGRLLQSELELYVTTIKGNIALRGYMESKRRDNILTLRRQAVPYETLLRLVVLPQRLIGGQAQDLLSFSR